MRRYENRRDAGRQLAARMSSWRNDPRAVVVGLPRGGVVVAAEIAAALDLPLDVLVVRKLGLPGQPEVAMGAIGEGGVVVLDEGTIRAVGVTSARVEDVLDEERAELERRERRYRAGRPANSLDGATVLVVDDGVATGSTARAACRVARARGASRVVLVVPVGASTSLRSLRSEADEVVALEEVTGPFAVGEWYEDFDQTSDEEVVTLLAVSPSGDGGAVPRDAASFDRPGATS